MTISEEYLVALTDYFDLASWPISAILPDAIDELLMVPPLTDPYTGDLQLGIYIPTEVALRIPGVDAFWLVVSPGAGGTLVRFDVHMSPFGLTLRVPLVLRVDTNILCPVNADDQPDRSAKTFDVTLGSIDLAVTADGHLDFDIGAANLPRCMVGTSGVIVEVGTLKWLSPSTPTAGLPPNTPAGFTGIYLDDVEVKVSQLLPGLNALRLDDGFLGTGGFSGKVSAPDLNLDWDVNAGEFTGLAHGELFGFQGGLSKVAIEFRQNALVGCEIGGDVFVPWFDKLIGLELGLTGAGELTALARTPHSPAATGVTVGPGGHLISIDVYGVLDINVDSILFDRPPVGPARLEITGSVKVSIDGFDVPEVGVKALRVDTDGKVAIDGGWMEVPSGTMAPFHGFPLEISKVGFGSEGSGADARMWMGLSGGIKLADGLPVGGSVDGLKISWKTTGGPDIRVSLSGVGIALDIPNVVKFNGSVSFFDDGTNQGFRGHGHLTLPSVGVGIDVNIVVGRNQITGETFFYFHLGVDLPVGIPLFQTGLAFYGFEGLVANNMGPDRRNGEPWYWGWYVREPHGATNEAKWAIQSGAFAAGLGTTIGTLPDTGFTVSAKILLILVLPGPVLLLEGKGSFLRKKPSGSEEGIFEALLALDVPAKLFTANLAATYSGKNLVTLHGGADVGFSWASPPPPHFWHLYLGEDQPLERRWRAELLSIFTANSYFMVEPSGLRLGAWIGFDEDWGFGPVHVWVKADISGEGEVSVDPQHLQGHMHLGGEAGVSAFGAKVVLGASADFDVSGPTPWEVSFDVEAHISIDLWLFSFDWSTTIHLEWKEPIPVLPKPALPVVERLAHQHLVIDQAGELDKALLAPDARQVVIFHRPVRDLAGIGAPAIATLAADVVGPAKFSYQLGHVALHRKSGGSWKVLGASGFVDVNSGSVAVPGLTLEGAAGSRLTLVGGQTYDVTAAAADSVTVRGTLPGGRAAYRLEGARPRANVQITAVGALGAGLATVTLAADPGIARDALGGGSLAAGGQQFAIAGNNKTSIMVRIAATTPAMPPLGSATAVGPDGPKLEGAWMPSDAGATKLMIGARTPFAQFHNTVDQSGSTFGIDSRYACGPEPVEKPTCITFKAAPLGPLGRPGITVGAVAVAGDGDTSIDAGGTPTHPTQVIQLGSKVVGHKLQGRAVFSFTGPVDRVWVQATTEEQATVTGTLDGAVVEQLPLYVGMRGVEITGPVDEVVVEGTLVAIVELCYLPNWTCTSFEAANFPQGTTGRQSYAGLTLESGGTMAVTNDLLTVKAPIRRRGGSIKPALDDIHLLPLPFVDVLDRFGVHPAAPLDPQRPRQVVPTIPGLSDPRDVFLPGIGVVGANPEERLPTRRRMRGVADSARDAANRATLRPDLHLGPAVDAPGGRLGTTLDPSWRDRWRVGGAIALSDVAAVTIYFPQPVTRVRIDVNLPANVTVAAGPVLVATGLATPGTALQLDAGTGWIDRVSISTKGQLQVREICTDAGEFGWQRFEQWMWQDSIRRSLSSFASESPVLPPGSYRLDVVTGWADEALPVAPTTWTTTSAEFTVGAPPGLRTGTTGPLNDLATYVDQTMPAAGERPFYRTYDIGVSFSRDYVSRMFLENATPLALGVTDSNGREIRPGTANVWGRGPELALTVEEQAWLATLHSDGTDPCASIDTSSVSRNEVMHGGAGELLLPAQLHTGVISVGGGTHLYGFDFVTSRYASFVHHVACFGGRRTVTTVTALDATALRAGLAPAEQELVDARTALAAASQAVASGIPAHAQFDALAATRARLDAAKAALGGVRRAAFAAAATASGISATRNRPIGVEVTVVDGAFLLESDEPLAWDRIALTARSAAATPQRRVVVEFDVVEFGAPDTGSFVYRGRLWRTTAELWARGGAVSARLSAAWTLTLELGEATRIDAEVDVPAGGTVTLHAAGAGASSDTVASTAGVTTLTVTGANLSLVELTGAGFAIRSITVTTPWHPQPAARGVRLVDIGLPSSTTDAGHYVELMVDGDVDLAGWRVEWQPADAAADWQAYHVAASVGRSMKAGGLARIFGGANSGTALAGRATWFGGTVGAVPVSGVVVRLVDPSGSVAHERAAMPIGTTVPCGLVPDGDLTRVYVLPATRTPGWWTLELSFARDVGPGEPVLSVGGDTTTETAQIGFRA